MRFAFVTSWWLDVARGSGTAKAITGLKKALEARGHSVFLVRPKGSRSLLRRLAFNLFIPKVRGADRIVCFDWDGLLLEGKHVCLKGVKAREAMHERGLPKLYLLAQSWLEKANCIGAQKVFVTSQHSKHDAISLYGLPESKVKVVPEGINLAEWAPLHDKRGETVLVVGHQYPRKNTRAVVSAWGRVLDAVPAARLRIVGIGPEIPMLKSMARGMPGISFAGHVKSLKGEYSKAALLCHPSLQESFGLVYAEAMASGLPVVALDAGAAPEVLGKAGVLVEKESQIAPAIISLLSSPALRSRLSRLGVARARKYSWDAVARVFERKISDKGKR